MWWQWDGDRIQAAVLEAWCPVWRYILRKAVAAQDSSPKAQSFPSSDRFLQTFQGSEGSCCHSSYCWTWTHPPTRASGVKNSFWRGLKGNDQQKKNTEGNGEISFQETQVHFHLVQIDSMYLRTAPSMDFIKKKILSILLRPLQQKNSFSQAVWSGKWCRMTVKGPQMCSLCWK